MTTTSSTVPATTTTSTAALPSGYGLFRDSKDKFSIAVPTSWRQIDPSSPTASKALQQVLQTNPQLTGTLGNGVSDLVAKGIKFFAVDPLGGTNNASVVSVLTASLPGASESDLPSVVDGLRSQMQQSGGVLSGVTTISLGGHQASQVKLRLSVNNAKGVRISLPATIDFVAANDQIYSVGLTGTSSAFPAIEQTFSVSP